MMNETCDIMWQIVKSGQIIMMKMCVGINNPNLLVENTTVSNETNITNMTSYIHNNLTNNTNNLTNSTNITVLSPSPILVPSFSIEGPSPSQLHTPSSSKTSGNYIRGIDYIEPSSSFINILKDNDTLTNTRNESQDTVLYIVSISMSTLVLVILLVLFIKRRKKSKVHICKSPPQVNYKIRRKNKDQSNKNLPRDYIIEHLPKKKKVMMI